MPYRRPESQTRLTNDQKVELLHQYFDDYRRCAEQDRAALNVKAPRADYAALLDQVGELLLAASRVAAAEPGPVQRFLKANPLPPALNGLLPDDFRALCLALNALKQ